MPRPTASSATTPSRSPGAIATTSSARFNDDKPYDQFIREQLAGDELDEVTAETIIATGYYRLGLWDDEPADPLLAYYDGLDDIVATTGQTFLGLTVNCARCHDHKIDPIPQADYYKLLAFFHGIKHYGVRSDETVAEASLRSIATPEQQAKFREQLAEHERRQVAELEARLNSPRSRIRSPRSLPAASATTSNIPATASTS
jgi:hypothetical protein